MLQHPPPPAPPAPARGRVDGSEGMMYAAGLLMGPGALERYRYVPRRSARPPCACSCDCQLQQTMPSSALPHPCRRRPAGASCAFVTTRCCSCTGMYLPCHHGYVAYDHQKRRRARVSIETLRPLAALRSACAPGCLAHAGLLLLRLRLRLRLDPAGSSLWTLSHHRFVHLYILS
jgi:hypothetical protein